MTGLEPWASVRGVADPSAARLALVRAGATLDLARLPADAPLELARLIADCTALDRAKRPRMGRVRAVLEQAHDEFLGGRFDVVRPSPNAQPTRPRSQLGRASPLIDRSLSLARSLARLPPSRARLRSSSRTAGAATTAASR